jgi:protein tyrosine/serine phosphatase
VFSSNDRSIHAQAGALLLALFVVAPVFGHAGPKIHIDNFGRVNSSYFRGAAPGDEEYANLAAFGIKTIVDLRSNDVESEDKLLVERAGMKYVQIPMTTHEPPARSVIEQFLRIVDGADNQPVYVHCVGGRHRTGIMTAVYRMTQDGWTADRAFKEMKAYRFGADFLHSEFKTFVFAYQPDLSHAKKIAE